MNEENIDFIVSNNIETNLKELDRALRFLNDYEQIDLILDDKRGYKLFKFIRFVTGLKKFQQELDLDCLFESSKAYEKFVNIFDFIIREIINDLDFENCAKNFNLKIDADYLVYNSDHEHIFIKWGKTSEWECFGGKLFGQCESNLKEITKDDIIYKCTICHIYNLCKDCFMQPKSEFTYNEQRIFILDDLLAILNSLMPYSFKLHLFLLEKSKLKIALDLINNEDFLKNAYTYSPDLIHSFLSIMNVLSKNSNDKKTVWKELNAIPSLLNVLNISSRLTLSVHSTLANIVDDIEIEQLNGLIQSIIQNDIKRLYKFATQFKKEQFTRYKQQFRDENNKIYFHEVAVLITKIGSLSLTDCLQNIYKLSLNPNAKLEIFNKSNFKKSIKIIIKHGNEIEKKFCIQVLAQLAFDSRVIDEIVKDSSLTSLVKKISQNDTIQLKKLKIASKQLLWLIQENDHETNRKIVDFDSSEGHIMISYHSNNRDICIQIKNELEKENFKVWVDLNEKSPSSLDSMVKAVERAKCVLICVNEVYRQNFNCQQSYEKVRGWLGSIIDSQYCIDFSCEKFEQSLSHLKSQISTLTFTRDARPKVSKHPPTIVIDSNKINEWSDVDVENWFKTINLSHSFIFNALFPCTGKILIQLRQMQVHAPDFFFKAISPKSLNISDLKTITTFSVQLSELFASN